MKVPFVDLKAQYQSIKSDIDSAINNVLINTAFIGGKQVSEFELAFAKMYGVKHCVSVANGTDSLYILMKMLGIGPGDEVITAANSWISSSETISQCGASPVFVDIDKDFYSINEHQLEAAITKRTKAIIPVHLQGQVCEMDTIMAIAARYGIPVIEDCAQSHFSEYKGKKAGIIGIAGSFSFYPGKNLGAYGDAGCIITNDDSLAERCRLFANHGAIEKHKHRIEGINSRMDGIQAAVLNVKLPHILAWNEQRIANAALYNKYLADILEIQLPKVRPSSKHTFHIYMIRTPQREALMAFLKEKEIDSAIHYPLALPNMEAYNYLGYKSTDFPVASTYQNEILSLPMYAELSEEQIAWIATCIKDFFRLNKR